MIPALLLPPSYDHGQTVVSPNSDPPAGFAIDPPLEEELNWEWSSNCEDFYCLNVDGPRQWHGQTRGGHK